MPRTPRNLLLIEDNRAYLRLVQECLRDGGGREFEVAWAGSLAEGLDHCDQGDVDVVLLDLLLPDNMGTDTLKKLRKEHPGLPIVVFTGVDDEDIAAEAVRFGAQDYICKGRLTGETLVRSLRYAIDTKRAERALVAHDPPPDDLGQRVRKRVETTFKAMDVLTARLQEALDPPRLADARQHADALATKTREVRRLLDHIGEYEALANGTERALSPVALDDAFDQALARLQPTLEGEPARITRTELPTIRGVEDEIVRLFEILLENAIRHRGEQAPEIHLSASLEEETWHLTLVDNGAGIEDEDLDRLLEPLQAGEDLAGAGMGTAIARRIVRDHGGELWFTSPGPGQGTTVHVTLMASVPTPPGIQRRAREEASEPQTP